MRVEVLDWEPPVGEPGGGDVDEAVKVV